MRDVVLSAVFSITGLIAGGAALVLAEFGAPPWALASLLAWLLTVSLPTFLAVVLLARFWPGPSFLAFITSAVILSFLLQFAAIAVIRWRLAHRRRRIGR